MIDVNHQVSAVRRTVGSRVLEAGEARMVTLSQSYPTDAADLWDACTNIERIPRWFLPISGDLKLGGQYRLEGNASGTILTCDPPRAFSATWEYGGAVSWIEVHITGEGPDEARLSWSTSRMSTTTPGASSRRARWASAGISAWLGWRSTWQRARASIPTFGQQWTTTDDGRRFMVLSSEAWYDANVAGGADPEAARVSADRCAAAYLAEA